MYSNNRIARGVLIRGLYVLVVYRSCGACRLYGDCAVTPRAFVQKAQPSRRGVQAGIFLVQRLLHGQHKGRARRAFERKRRKAQGRNRQAHRRAFAKNVYYKAAVLAFGRAYLTGHILLYCGDARRGGRARAYGQSVRWQGGNRSCGGVRLFRPRNGDSRASRQPQPDVRQRRQSA